MVTALTRRRKSPREGSAAGQKEIILAVSKANHGWEDRWLSMSLFWVELERVRVSLLPCLPFLSTT
jgi:hypothetical protein